MTFWRLDPKLRQKVERFDAKPFHIPYGDGYWLVELDLSAPQSNLLKHSDGSLWKFESKSAAWSWIEANRGAES